MLRICGATVERDPLSQRTCWCAGLFCGRGGARESSAFRHDFKTDQIAYSREQFAELLAQQDLFDEGALRAKWEGRIALHVDTRRKGRQAKCRPTPDPHATHATP